MKQSIMPPLKYDKTKSDGWKLLSNITSPITKFELVSVLREEENSVPGGEFLKRAKKDNLDLGQNVAEYLVEHQDEIPQEWKDYCLVFPGTVWQDSYGNRYVPYLRWSGERWHLGFLWLVRDWRSYDRLLRAVKSSGTRNLGKKALGTSVAKPYECEDCDGCSPKRCAFREGYLRGRKEALAEVAAELKKREQ